MAWVWGPSFVSLLVFMGKSVHFLDEQKQPPNWRGLDNLGGLSCLKNRAQNVRQGRRRCARHGERGALGGPDSRSQALVGRRAVGPAAPSGETLPDEVGNGTAVVINKIHPRPRNHFRVIDFTGTHTGDGKSYSLAQPLVL